ncbi:hypothetical protein [Rickettsiales endosymbiont of Stachyamoeba lipophora]|uniref:hypothetical protein n=1 Tax=Rickettsiales endosymbiont of Stachyamoeba lipophora TaxID=2486578 RepID=UPI000F64D5B3|nr:hypothetical protein [Rickettsiales endosymbiont of Stachyamoeba lipophora]AZL16189.1 hypothetical protein EF513_06565 [Rickettsiales endosymbiont of Stachyamoeba lipophora]
MAMDVNVNYYNQMVKHNKQLLIDDKLNNTLMMNKAGQDKEMMNSAQGFAQMMMKQFLEIALPPMQDNLFGGGQVEKLFHDLYLDEVSDRITAPENSALTLQIYNEIAKLNKSKV